MLLWVIHFLFRQLTAIALALGSLALRRLISQVLPLSIYHKLQRTKILSIYTTNIENFQETTSLKIPIVNTHNKL